MCGADPDRRSRFHTLQGEFISFAECWRTPKLLMRRVLGQQSEGPWLAPPAVAWLDSILEESWTALECGAGSSTSWLAHRVGHLISLESDPGWYSQVNETLQDGVSGKCELLSLSLPDQHSFVVGLRDDSLDFALVDSAEALHCSRLDLVAAVAPKIRPAGYLMLDDSDRPRLSGVAELLPSWSRVRFVGMKMDPIVAVETSVWQRPGSSPNSTTSSSRPSKCG